MSLSKFHVGQKVRIDLEAVKSSNRWCKTPGYPSGNFIRQLESLITEFGPVGVVTHTFEPTYDLTVGGHAHL